LEQKLVPDMHRSRVLNNFRSYESVLKQIHAQKEAHKIREEEQKKQQKKENKKVNTNKKSTKVPEKTGYKKRPKQKA
jgi:hypothetical protein